MVAAKGVKARAKEARLGRRRTRAATTGKAAGTVSGIMVGRIGSAGDGLAKASDRVIIWTLMAMALRAMASPLIPVHAIIHSHLLLIIIRLQLLILLAIIVTHLPVVQLVLHGAAMRCAAMVLDIMLKAPLNLSAIMAIKVPTTAIIVRAH